MLGWGGGGSLGGYSEAQVAVSQFLLCLCASGTSCQTTTFSGLKRNDCSVGFPNRHCSKVFKVSPLSWVITDEPVDGGFGYRSVVL